MADPIEVPTPPDTPHFEQRTVLDGQEYIMVFIWDGREGRWYHDLLTTDRVKLVCGVKLVCNWPLYRPYQWDTRVPQGLMMAVDYSDQGGEPPGLGDLGRRVRLSYTPKDPVIPPKVSEKA